MKDGTIASPPAALISFTQLSPSSSFVPTTMTFAPSFAKSSAVALPIPLVEPVMIATLFSNFMAMPSLSSSCFHECCVNEIKAAGGEAIFCKTDVTSDESLDNLVKTALDAYGKIDILVNNAGVGGTTANMDQITMDEWNTVLATNLTAPFVLCKKLIPIMEKQGAGTIVHDPMTSDG